MTRTAAERSRAYRERRAAAGLCCNKPCKNQAEPPWKSCRACRERRNGADSIYVREWRKWRERDGWTYRIMVAMKIAGLVVVGQKEAAAATLRAMPARKR